MPTMLHVSRMPGIERAEDLALRSRWATRLARCLALRGDDIPVHRLHLPFFEASGDTGIALRGYCRI